MSQPISKRHILSSLASLGLSALWPVEADARAKKKAKTKAKSKKKLVKKAPVITGPLKSDFVAAEGIDFKLHNQSYHYVGANIWYGAYLGADSDYGNRARLIKELDDLKDLGVVNLRVLASSELSPLKNSLDPAFRTKTSYNEALLEGLDFLMVELARRDMRAVLYLTNFWEWSGGMSTYNYWTNGGHYIDMGDPAHPWPEFADESSKFYKNQPAIALYHDYIRKLVGRVNVISGKPYKDDVALMAWQLCNEPRAGGETSGVHKNAEAYLDWIASSCALIRSIDPNHMISLGHEGLMGIEGDEALLIKAHEHIDYLTAHIWPLNWSWVDGKNLADTFEAGAQKVKTYIAQHIAIAQKLNKPLVFEEFGFPRDDIAYEPGSPTLWRDKFYGFIYASVEEAIRHHTPVAGSNFWAWGGTGRALHPDYHMLRGETSFVGDPPHEPQGWNSVFNIDTSTQAMIRKHAANIAQLSVSN